MSRLNWSLLIAYLTAAAAYGGWRGSDLWSDGIVWLLLLPPFLWATIKAVGDWWRNPYWISVKTGFMMTVFAIVAIGGQALVLAWIVSEATPRWSADPTVRAIVGAGSIAAFGAIVWATKQLGKPADLPPANDEMKSGATGDPLV